MRCDVALILVVCADTSGIAEELTPSTYWQILDTYRAGDFREAAEAIGPFPLDEVGARNEELRRGLDLSRPEEARTLRAAVVLNAEAAFYAAAPLRSDFLLDQSVALSTVLPVDDGIDLQKRVHLAVAYRLYAERRVVDATRVLEPAATRYPADVELQFALGTLAELSGWLEASQSDLTRAETLYRRVLELEPTARTQLRLARVLTLLGRDRYAVPLAETGLTGTLDDHDRVVGLLTLGDALRRTGRSSEAVDVYRRALELDPGCQAARVALAHALQQLGRSDEARSIVSAPVAPDDADSFQRYLLGDSIAHVRLWRELRQSVR